MSSKAAGTPLVLFVDDEPKLGKVFIRAVESLPVRVRVALSGDEALEVFEQEVPILVITDYRMPGMDGLELLERIRARHRSVQCVLHSGETHFRSTFGMDVPVLAKPCPDKVFRELVEYVLESTDRGAGEAERS